MRDLATKYSDACTRAGFSALLATVLSFSFAGRLNEIKPLEAFGKYVLGRENLEIALEELTSSRYWAPILESANSTPTGAGITLTELSTLVCMDSSTGGTSVRQRRQNDPLPGTLFNTSSATVGVGDDVREETNSTPLPVTNDSRQPGDQQLPNPPVLAPQAPTLTITTTESCPGVDQILAAVKPLWDEETLSLGRKSSNEADVEIYRWQLRRNRSGRWISFTSEDSIASGDITLQELEQLSELPRTTVAEFSARAQQLTTVAEPYSPGSGSLSFSSVLVATALLISVAYFYINFNAAYLANLLLVPGTVFATMWANAIGRVFYVVVLALPAVGSVTLSTCLSGNYGLVAKGLALATILLTASLFFHSVPHALRLRFLAAMRDPFSARP